jgi:hypothetical protein
MTDPNLYLLTHPENWPHKGLLPVIRRGGNIVYNKKDAGIIRKMIYVVSGQAII